MSTPSSTRKHSVWDTFRSAGRADGEECMVTKSENLLEKRPSVSFCTGSKYSGTWDLIEMNGHGVFTLSNGVKYVGAMKDGMFDGLGTLMLTDGAKMHGHWRRGELVRRTFVFADELVYSENDLNYCQVPDRRFHIEHMRGLETAGKSYMTNHQPTRAVPEGMFDTEDGFYDPKTKMVYQPDDLTVIKRAPVEKEQRWIVKNCRTAPDFYRGPCKHLFKEWTGPKITNLPKKDDKPRRKTVSIE